MSSGSDFTIRHLNNPTDPEIECIVTVLARAFGEDEVFGQMLTGGDISLIPHALRASVKAGAIGGEIFVATTGPDPENIVGAAVWFGPGQDRASSQRNVLDGFIRVLPDELQQWHTEYLASELTELTEKTVGSTYKLNSWYLNLLGVIPGYQRKGILRAFIKTVAELAQEQNIPLVVEATALLNVIIYKQLGFQARGEVRLISPVGKVSVVLLTKETDSSLKD